MGGYLLQIYWFRVQIVKNKSLRGKLHMYDKFKGQRYKTAERIPYDIYREKNSSLTSSFCDSNQLQIMMKSAKMD